MSRLIKSAAPILGRVATDADNNATLLAVRLDPSMRDLATVIVDGFSDADATAR